MLEVTIKVGIDQKDRGEGIGRENVLAFQNTKTTTASRCRCLLIYICIYMFMYICKYICIYTQFCPVYLLLESHSFIPDAILSS